MAHCLLRSFSMTLLLCAFAILSEAVHALWPQPRNLRIGSGALRLDASFTIRVAIPNAPQDLLDAAERTRASLFSDQLGRLVVGRGADDLQNGRPANMLSSLTLTILGDTSAALQSIATEATLPWAAEMKRTVSSCRRTVAGPCSAPTRRSAFSEASQRSASCGTRRTGRYTRLMPR